MILSKRIPISIFTAVIFITSFSFYLQTELPAKSKIGRWQAYPGPNKVVKITGKTAWALKYGFSTPEGPTVTLGVYRYSRRLKTENIFRFVDEWAVPGVFSTNLYNDKDLKVGDGIFFSQFPNPMVHYGRVVKVKGDKIEVNFEFVSKIKTTTVKRKYIIKLRGKTSYGEPVAYIGDFDWQKGTLVYMGKKKAWVTDFVGTLKQVQAKNVRALSAFRQYKKGDKVLASLTSSFQPAKITKVLDGGLRYLTDKNIKPIMFTQVTDTATLK